MGIATALYVEDNEAYPPGGRAGLTQWDLSIGPYLGGKDDPFSPEARTQLFMSVRTKNNGKRLNYSCIAADINPGPASSFPQYPSGFGSEICFSANDGYFYDWELWSIKATRLFITGIQRLPDGVRITWVAPGGSTNVVQVADNIAGPFTDLSPPLTLPGADEVTGDYVDTTPVNGTRFYRIVQP